MTEKPDTLTYRTTNFTLQQVPVPLDIHATTRDTIDALFTFTAMQNNYGHFKH
ncbi:MAG: hypothetical protein U0T75_09570 [Chitinophagales bacterium]